MVRIQSLFALSFSAVEFAASSQAEPTWKVCKEDTDYTPDGKDASWNDNNCHRMIAGTFPDGFTPSKETCKEEATDPQDQSKKFIVGKVLGSFAATCCGGAGKDACAEHGPFSFQEKWKVCEEDDTYNPTGSHSSWSGLTCDVMLEATIGATFPDGFTASKQTCHQEGTDPQDPTGKFIVGQVLGNFAETCCGGIGKDSCVEYAEDLFCQKPADFVVDEIVKHNNKDVLCRDVAFEVGLSVAPSEKLCAEKIDANGVEGVRSKFMEDYKAKCCGGKDSMCTKFHTSPSESDGNNNSTTDTDQTSGAFHVATLTVPAAMTLFMSI